MRITNTSKTTRTLSHRGAEHLLPPGAFVEVPATKVEADGLRLFFDVSGEHEGAPTFTPITEPVEGPAFAPLAEPAEGIKKDARK